MALSIKTEDADRLARELARLTGETMTEAVTTALRERLARERANRKSRAGLSKRIARITALMRRNYDRKPVTKAELDWASGDED